MFPEDSHPPIVYPVALVKGKGTPTAKSYLEFLLWHYRVVDGFWFLCVEENYGRKVAEHFDECYCQMPGEKAQIAAFGRHLLSQ